MKCFLLALTAFFPTMANARTVINELNLSEVELRVRIEMNDARGGYVIIQTPNNPDNVCGWFSQKITNGKSIDWHLFFYDKNMKGKNDNIVILPYWKYENPESSSLFATTFSIMALQLCYKHGYIPSPMPVGPYAEKFLRDLTK